MLMKHHYDRFSKLFDGELNRPMWYTTELEKEFEKLSYEDQTLVFEYAQSRGYEYACLVEGTEV